MTTDEPRSEESDTPVEENEEVMWPEGGVLLTFVEKASRKQKENIATEIQVTPTIEEPEGGTVSSTLFPTGDDKANEKLLKPPLEDVLIPKEDCENSEKSQKSQIDSVVHTLPTRSTYGGKYWSLNGRNCQGKYFQVEHAGKTDKSHK